MQATRRYLPLALLPICLCLSGCNPSILNPQGPIGAAEKTILLNSVSIMLAIVIPTIVATLIIAWWFRESNTSARYRPTFAYSGRIELVVWSIPILVILFLGGIIWIGSHQLDPAQPPSQSAQAPQAKPLDVQVVSLDWKWLFIYPEQGIASVNEVVVPAGTPIHFYLTSSSVMNVFFVPQLGSMIYTMNGMVSQLHLQADRPGNYYGISAQYSGDGFSDMHFVTRALPADQFAGWIARTRSSGPVLDPRSYAALARHSVERRPFTYRAVAPGLFDAIATQKIPPSPGPRTGRPERSQHVSPEDVG